MASTPEIEVDRLPVDYDCQPCGACCNSQWTGEGYVSLSEEEAERLANRSLPIILREAYIGADVLSPYLGTKIDDAGYRVCAAFSGEIGSFTACTIYDDRPEPCRRYKAGSPDCKEARKRHGLPVD